MIGVIKIVATIKINAANLFIFFQIYLSVHNNSINNSFIKS